MITRLYDYSSGNIKIDDIEIKELNIRELRKMIGIVQQEPTLFYGTIFENIALGDKSITMERVEKVCQMANAHEFIMNLSDVKSFYYKKNI